MHHQILFLIVIFCVCCAQGVSQPVPQIIFDTDMGPDYDDVGALAVLHALAAEGECDILATMSSNGHSTAAPTIEVINRYFGRSDVPIGVPGSHAPDFTADNGWNDSLITRFLPGPKTNEDYPPAIELYRKILAGMPDSSVTIVTVGFMSNLAELLKSRPDRYSPLSGRELVGKKVKQYVAMAGMFPQGREFNVFTDAASSAEVFRHWPGTILFTGFEIGNKIHTGGRTAQSEAENSPVQWAYEFCLETFEGKKVDGRPSWDQTAVLCAIRPADKYFYVNGPGRFVMEDEGANHWDPETDADHFFLTHKYPYEYVENVIEELMMYIPE